MCRCRQCWGGKDCSHPDKCNQTTHCGCAFTWGCSLSLSPTLFICVVSTSREKEPPLSRARATFYLQRFVAPTRVGDVCLEFSSQQSLLLCFPIVAELMIASLSALNHFPDPNVLQGSMASPSLLLLPSPDLWAPLTLSPPRLLYPPLLIYRIARHFPGGPNFLAPCQPPSIIPFDIFRLVF